MAVTAQICVSSGLMLIWDVFYNTEEGNESKSNNFLNFKKIIISFFIS